MTEKPTGPASYLRRAGLVTGRREGRSVIYTRTTKGHTLCGRDA